MVPTLVKALHYKKARRRREVRQAIASKHFGSAFLSASSRRRRFICSLALNFTHERMRQYKVMAENSLPIDLERQLIRFIFVPVKLFPRALLLLFLNVVVL